VLSSSVPGLTDSVSDLTPLLNLWVSGSQRSNIFIQGIKLNITYGVGYADGDIVTAPVSFINSTVPKQALLASTSFSNPVTSYGASGILGLGQCLRGSTAGTEP
jgi:hypothetical protein